MNRRACASYTFLETKGSLLVLGLWFGVLSINIPAGAQEWANVVSEAKKEGALVIAGPGGTTVRSLMNDFQARFPGIKLEITSFLPRDFTPRVLSERRSGKKLWDVHFGGVNTMYTTLKSSGAIQELRPALLLPEVKEDKYWHGGLDFGFVDKERKYVYAFLANITPPVYVNRTSIPAAQFTHPKQLIDPRFKSRIAMDDPRFGGSGLLELTALMGAYGEDFVKKFLIDQNVIVTRDLRQLSEWLVRGRYPLAVGLPPNRIEDFRAQGLAKDVETVWAVEVEVWNPGLGGVVLMEGAPNPNAARVFLNWLLSKSTQDLWSKSTALNSRRTDVPIVDKEIFPKPERLHQYIRSEEAWEPVREKAIRLAKDLLK